MGLILSERQTMNNPSKELQFNLAGHWLITKFKARAQESGYYAADDGRRCWPGIGA